MYCKKCNDITVTETIIDRINSLIIALETAIQLDNPDTFMNTIIPICVNDILCRYLCKQIQCNKGKKLKDIKLINSTAFLFEEVPLKYLFPITTINKNDQLMLYDLCLFNDSCDKNICNVVDIAITAATCANPLNDNTNQTICNINNACISNKTQKVYIVICNSNPICACITITDNIIYDPSTIFIFPINITNYFVSALKILWSNISSTIQNAFITAGIDGSLSNTTFINISPFSMTFSKHISITIECCYQPNLVIFYDTTTTILTNINTNDVYYTYDNITKKITIYTKKSGIIGLLFSHTANLITTDYSYENLYNWITNLRTIIDAINVIKC